jgi:hypothetical protein
MDNPQIPNITSFVIRFVHTEPGSPPGAACRGSVTHIQTNQELSFTHWADAVAFIQRFVPLSLPDPASPGPEPSPERP